MAFEYGRPSNTLHIPMIVSLLLFLFWLSLPVKKWNVQIRCFLILLGVMAIEVPFAANNYHAFWTTYGMAALFLCIAIPLIHFTDSLRKLALLINTWMVVFLYVGTWAIFHEGFGPAGTDGHDENFVGAMMTMVLPFAYFSVAFKGSAVRKTLLGLFCLVYLQAIVVGMSRGAFLGLCVVLAYSLKRSAKKWVGWAMGIGLVIAVSLLASEKYWGEMATITDTEEATADARIEMWKVGVRMFQHHPITGVGPGNFPWRLTEFQFDYQFEKFGRGLGAVHAHSLNIQLIAELGLAGIIVFLVILYQNYKDAKLIEQVVKQARERLQSGIVTIPEGQRNSYMADLDRAYCFRNALIGSLLGCLVTSAFISTLYMSYFWILTAMMVALREICLSRWHDKAISP
ncbi:MAG: O-antigen ligase family protein [Nitrospiraceae bacterium]